MNSKDALRAIGIFNGHNAMTAAKAAGYDGPDILLTYAPTDTGRGGRSAYWRVSSLSHKTDPDGHWQDYGHKTFTVWGTGTHAEIKTRTLKSAQEWAAARYGVTEWAKVPGLPGYLLPVQAAAVVKGLLREKVRATA